ncbi:type 1 fimbrial protein [Escherichia coli]|uniref:type 1 fimbrial protein n=1 Tax=Escherichia coli TaxID=562 RepID=UPI001FCE84BC|nr:type 1 fimbrial protein [Escherichia coli]
MKIQPATGAFARNLIYSTKPHFYGQIVEPACDVSTQSSPVEMNCPQNGSVPGRTYSSKALMSGNVKNAQIASVKVQYLDKQKKLAVMNIEYN